VLGERRKEVESLPKNEANEETPKGRPENMERKKKGSNIRSNHQRRKSYVKKEKQNAHV